MYHSGRGWLMSPLLAHQRSQQVCTILCRPVAAQIEENTLCFENIDVKMSKWTSILCSIGTLLLGWKQSSCFFFFLAAISSGLLRNFLGWTFLAFSGCSARSLWSFTAGVTFAGSVERISPVFWGGARCLGRMSHPAFLLSAPIWMLQFRDWALQASMSSHKKCSVSPAESRCGYI